MKVIEYSKLAALALCGIMFFTSCEKEEPVKEPAPVNTVEIPMGADYANQYFFDLETNTVVSNNSRQAWDLAFESSPYGYHIFLNSSKLMFAYNSNRQTMGQVTTYNQSRSKYDEPSGDPAFTAIGEWGHVSGSAVESYSYVYLIDRGRDANGQPIPPVKMIVEGLVHDTYTVHFSNLDGTNDHTVELTKSAVHNRLYLSFENGGTQVNVEPEKAAWDLQFTMYTHIFNEAPVNIPFPADTLPYLVNGVLQNMNGVQIAKDTTLVFDSITMEDSYRMEYSTAANTIGYDWKTFEFNDENYTIEPNRNYFIKTPEGNTYKLRFIDFYNHQGVKGYPTFQFQKLN